MGIKEHRMDLHVHTCLSPCAEPDMVPTRIIAEARARKLDVVGICDHNSAENVPAVKKAGERQGVAVLGGMEICSSEEVHVLGLFGEDRALLEMQEIVHENLPGRNDAEYFGYQLVVDEDDNILGYTDKLLIGATTLSVERIVELVHERDGLAVASHVDRESFSIIAQLGFIPEDLHLDGIEVSWKCEIEDAGAYQMYGLPLFRASDAHFPSDIGKVATRALLETWSFPELTMAFRGMQGRAIVL